MRYNAIIDHEGRALALMPGAYGIINDKNVVRSDEEVEKIKSYALVTGYEYTVFREYESEVMTKGKYMVVDGGYLKRKSLQCGKCSAISKAYVIWRKCIEYVNKESKCYVGRSKKRFKILRVSNLLYKKLKLTI